MKKITLITAIAMIAFTTNAVAQATAEATASSATVVAPIGITSTATLAFGNLAVAGAGTVVLPSAGLRTSTGGVTLTTNAGTVNPAGFSVTGEGTYAYTLTLPGDLDVVLTDGATTPNTMTVTGFESSLGVGGNGALTAGAQTFTVGATLNATAGQVAAAYTGTFDVTVAYD